MASDGSLIVNTFLANESIPVKDAIITVTEKDGDKTLLIGIRRTDENGKTSPIIIKTPDKEYSLEPQDEVKPFTSVDVRADHPATYTSITENVQIFPGQISIENVMLIPLEDNVKEDDRQNTTNITPQEL